MALARVKSWVALEVLFAADLNGEFNNILNNALSLISPLTGNLDVNSNQLLNARFEVKTATQTVTLAGRTYWQSSRGSLDIDTGTFMAAVPAMTTLKSGALIGMVNPTAYEGATSYATVTVGTGLSLNQTTNSLNVTAGPVGVLQTQVFS